MKTSYVILMLFWFVSFNSFADTTENSNSGILIFPNDFYCYGDCPVKIQVRGFDVFLSPSMHDKPLGGTTMTSYEFIGKHLDLLHAQLLFFEGFHSGVSDTTADKLRSAGVSIYLGYQYSTNNGEYVNSADDDPYWPCNSGACYNPINNQIGMWIGLLDWRQSHSSTLIHELAHAYHDTVVPDGFNNQCVQDLYQDSKNKGLLDRPVEQMMHLSSVTPNTRHDDPVPDTLRQKIQTREADGGLIKVSYPPYAAKNHLEYFAVAASALFGLSNTYPHNVNDQWRWDKNQWYLHRFWTAIDTPVDEWTPAECEAWILEN